MQFATFASFPTASIIIAINLLMAAHASSAQPAIYRCIDEGEVLYTDRPCEGGAEPHELDDSRVTVYTPAPVVEPTTQTTPARQSKERRARSERAPDPDAHRAKCAGLNQRLRDVRSKMRMGYGVKEGERLKARRRQLNEQRRAQKCG